MIFKKDTTGLKVIKKENEGLKYGLKMLKIKTKAKSKRKNIQLSKAMKALLLYFFKDTKSYHLIAELKKFVHQTLETTRTSNMIISSNS